MYELWSQGMNETKRSLVKSADRVLDVLEVLAHKGRPLTHTELSVELSIPKSSLSQLLANLVERGYVAFAAGPNTYGIGTKLMELVERQRRNVTLPGLAQPLCDRITRITDESSSLNLRRDDFVERVCGASSTQPLNFSIKLGELAPMYAVSSGKVLLAWMSEEELATYFATTKLVAFTKRTITSVAALRRELGQVRKNSAAWSVEEYTPGIVGVAVPVFHEGAPIGAFNIAMPHVRDNASHRRRLVSALRDAAISLERALGGVRSAPSSFAD
jgi:DNA-binding IclR family transcriptional regulator